MNLSDELSREIQELRERGADPKFIECLEHLRGQALEVDGLRREQELLGRERWVWPQEPS